MPMSRTSEHSAYHFWRTPSSPQTSAEYFHFPSQAQAPDSSLRALEALQLERTYLLNSLHAQNHTAAQLKHRIPLLESKLQEPAPRALHRKLRKQLGWVKSRLGQASVQERTISSRLDQLSCAIQARERWAQVEHEQRRLDLWRRDQILQGLLCDGLQLRPPLDPQQPDFQPQGYFPQWQSEGSADASQTTEDVSYPSHSSPPTEPETPPGGCEYAAVRYNSHQPHLSRRSASLGSIFDLGFLATGTSYVPISALKRHSFLSLPGCSVIWNPTAAEQADADAGVENRTEEG